MERKERKKFSREFKLEALRQTDMGKSIADMISSGKREVMENPFIMIDRKSF